VILVNLDYLTAHAAGDLAQLALLIGRGLIEGGDSEIDNRPAHSLASSFAIAHEIRFPKWRVLLTFLQHNFEGFIRTGSDRLLAR
jgi:hypothetical protein